MTKMFTSLVSRLVMICGLTQIHLCNPPNTLQAQARERRASPDQTEKQNPQRPSQEEALAEAQKLLAQYQELYNQGKYDEALLILQRTLVFFRRAFGAEHPMVSAALHNLAFFYSEKGDFAQAEQMYKEAISIMEKSPEPSDAALGTMLNNLGDLYLRKGDYAQAEQFLDRGLKLREKVYGPNHPDVGGSLNSIVNLYQAKGDYKRALPLLLRTHKIVEQSVGSTHPDMGTTLNNLGVVYQALGDYARAEEALKRGRAIREAALGSEHPDVAQSLHNQGALYREKGNHKAAEEMYRRALRIREKVFGSEHADVSNSLNSLGILYYEIGEYARAGELFRRALSIAEKALGVNHPDVALSSNNLAGLYQEIGDYRQADEFYQRSLKIFEQALGPRNPALADPLTNLAGLYMVKGDFARAEEHELRAMVLVEEALGGEHVKIAKSLNNLGLLYKIKGEYERADEAYRRALRITEKALGRDHWEFANTLNNLGVLNYERGDYVRAEEIFQESLAVQERSVGVNHKAFATTLSNAAMLHKAKGEYLRAEAEYARALAVSEKALGLTHPELVAPLTNLANLYLDAGKYDKAEPLYRRSLALVVEAFGEEHTHAAAQLSGLAILHSKKGEYAAAENLLRRALAINEKNLGASHPANGMLLNNLGGIYRGKGNYAEAESLFRRALAVNEKALGGYHPDMGLVLVNQALLSWERGAITQAVRTLIRSNDIRERNLALTLTTGSENQKLLYLNTLVRESFVAISLHVNSAPRDPEAAHLALTTILQRKGRALDAIADEITTLRRRADPQTQVSLNRLKAARAQLAALVWAGTRGAGSEQHLAETAQLAAAVEELEMQISARHAEFRAQTQAVTPELVQLHIPADASLLEFSLYYPFDVKIKPPGEQFREPRYVAYVLRREGPPRFVDLGPAALIEQSVTHLREALRDPRRQDVKALAQKVGVLLLSPVRGLLGDTTKVLISPDGLLNLIPFEVLVDEQNRYSVENYSFIYLTSGRDLLRLHTAPPSRQESVVIADPEFDWKEGSVGPGRASRYPGPSRRSRSFQGHFDPLPGTAEEARQIGALLKVKPLTGVQATEATLKRLRGPKLLHVATHGFFLPNEVAPVAKASKVKGLHSPLDFTRDIAGENPLLRSGLALTGANHLQGGEGQDGILTALEAYGLDLWGTKMVVLSACETGVGQTQNGEGVYGLRRALLLAGAESQVISLWKVNDEATRELMVAYYKRLQAGEARDQALRQVRLEMLKRSELSHPYYWSGFIHSGDWGSLTTGGRR